MMNDEAIVDTLYTSSRTNKEKLCVVCGRPRHSGEFVKIYQEPICHCCYNYGKDKLKFTDYGIKLSSPRKKGVVPESFKKSWDYRYRGKSISSQFVSLCEDNDPYTCSFCCVLRQSDDIWKVYGSPVCHCCYIYYLLDKIDFSEYHKENSQAKPSDDDFESQKVSPEDIKQKNVLPLCNVSISEKNKDFPIQLKNLELSISQNEQSDNDVSLKYSESNEILPEAKLSPNNNLLTKDDKKELLKETLSSEEKKTDHEDFKMQYQTPSCFVTPPTSCNTQASAHFSLQNTFSQSPIPSKSLSSKVHGLSTYLRIKESNEESKSVSDNIKTSDYITPFNTTNDPQLIHKSPHNSSPYDKNTTKKLSPSPKIKLVSSNSSIINTEETKILNVSLIQALVSKSHRNTSPYDRSSQEKLLPSPKVKDVSSRSQILLNTEETKDLNKSSTNQTLLRKSLHKTSPYDKVLTKKLSSSPKIKDCSSSSLNTLILEQSKISNAYSDLTLTSENNLSTLQCNKDIKKSCSPIPQIDFSPILPTTEEIRKLNTPINEMFLKTDRHSTSLNKKDIAKELFPSFELEGSLPFLKISPNVIESATSFTSVSQERNNHNTISIQNLAMKLSYSPDTEQNILINTPDTKNTFPDDQINTLQKNNSILYGLVETIPNVTGDYFVSQTSASCENVLNGASVDNPFEDTPDQKLRKFLLQSLTKDDNYPTLTPMGYPNYYIPNSYCHISPYI